MHSKERAGRSLYESAGLKFDPPWEIIQSCSYRGIPILESRDEWPYLNDIKRRVRIKEIEYI